MKGKIISGILIMAAGGGIVGGLLLGKNDPQQVNTLLEDRITAVKLKIYESQLARDPNSIRVARMSMELKDYQLRAEEKWDDVAIALNEARKNMNESTVSDLETKSDDAIISTPCNGGISEHDGYRVCITDFQSFPEEVLTKDIPLKDQKRKVVCCDTNSVYTDSETEPACEDPIIIDDNILVDVSMCNVTTELDKKAMAKCCSECTGECWVRPCNWDACPRCLCDSSCGNYCQ